MVNSQWSTDFGFWILDFGLMPTTRVQGLPTLDDQFWFCYIRFAVGVFTQKFSSKIYNPESRIGSQ